MATKNRFGDFASERVKEPEYPLPPTAPSAPARSVRKTRSTPKLQLSSSSPTVPFGSYMTPEDDARLRMLVAKVGKKKVRLFAEALALLFEHYKTDLAE